MVRDEGHETHRGACHRQGTGRGDLQKGRGRGACHLVPHAQSVASPVSPVNVASGNRLDPDLPPAGTRWASAPGPTGTGSGGKTGPDPGGPSEPRRPGAVGEASQARSRGAPVLDRTRSRAGPEAAGPEDGGRNRARTCDLLRVKQALCQLSYSPFASVPVPGESPASAAGRRGRYTMATGTRTQYPRTRRIGARVIDPAASAR